MFSLDECAEEPCARKYYNLADHTVILALQSILVYLSGAAGMKKYVC